MKKILIAALAAVICLGAIASTGCGGDTGKAIVYMEQGDTLSKKMRSLTDSATFDAGALLAELGIQVAETGGIDPGTITDEANKQLDSVIANGEKAGDEYKKILELKGVEDYKEYAEQRMKAIDSATKVLEAVQELLDEIGDPANKKSVRDTFVAWAKSNLKVAVEAVRAYSSWRNAEKIKKEKGLAGTDEPVEDSAPATAPK